MCPIFFFIPFTRGQVSVLLTNTPSLSICSRCHQPVSRPGLFSHFLTIGLFSSAYYSTLRKTFPSLHTLCQLFLLFEILFQGQISLESSSMLHLPFSHSKTISALTMCGVLPRPPCCGIQWHVPHLSLTQLGSSYPVPLYWTTSLAFLPSLWWLLFNLLFQVIFFYLTFKCIFSFHSSSWNAPFLARLLASYCANHRTHGPGTFRWPWERPSFRFHPSQQKGELGNDMPLH